MKQIYLAFFSLCLIYNSYAQDLVVSGECINSPVSLTQVADVNGKPAFQGTGTVQGISNVLINVYWMGDPDNVYVIDFDGQPYFMNTCNTSGPASTERSDCPWTEVVPMTCTGTQPLSVTGTDAVLTVKYSAFTATGLKDQVELIWKTTQEINNRGFHVERSVDGINWTYIGFVAGAGNSTIEISYQFTDRQPAEGNNFYRLVQEDFDGKRSFSRILNINITNTNQFAYLTGHNPGKGLFGLRINTSSRVEMSVIDLSGKIILQRSVRGGIHLLDLSDQAPGIYLLHLKSGTQLNTIKLIKQ